MTLDGRAGGHRDERAAGHRDERAAGHRDERHAGLVPVACTRCGAEVLVTKFSPQHTSVQWSAAAVLACSEFAASGRPSALVEGCASLRDSIDAAMAAGRLEVSPPR